MGLWKPVHVLQRGAEVNEIVNVAAIAVVDAQEAERRAGMVEQDAQLLSDR
jgi:malate dehydrogenase (oxaloacetate-decarboxylating)(NADP+)